MQIGEYDEVPIFETEKEAEEYAQTIGCRGSHSHLHYGREAFMPCASHIDALDYIQDYGMSLEDMLDNHKISYMRVVDNEEEISQKYLKKLANSNMDGEKFYRIVSNPNEKSIFDLSYRKFRFIYAPGEGAPDLVERSRGFCIRMMGFRQRVYRYEDIMNLSAQIQAEDPDRKIIPRPMDSGPVDIWTWKGGAGCKHRWIELWFDTDYIIPDNANQAMVDSLGSSPADGQTGQINLPPNYAGRPQQGMSKQEFDYDVSSLAPYAVTTGETKVEEFIEKIPYEKKDDYISRCVSWHMKNKGWDSDQSYAVCVNQADEAFSKSSQKVIIVDIDDTIVHNGKAMMKTLEYIDEKKDDFRIVIVSGRPVARLEETKKELDDLGVYYDEIYLQDFSEETSGEVGKKFKEYKAKKLIDSGFQVVEAIENDEETRNVYDQLGIHAMNPKSIDVSFKPVGFAQGYGIFRDKETARDYSEFCGCGGSIEPYMFKGEKMFLGCGKTKKQSFSLLEEKKMLYAPVMIPGKIIPRIDADGSRYAVKFTPDAVRRMAHKYLKEKRTDKVNYEHTNQMLNDVYMVESWIIESEKDKAYDYFDKEQIPIGTWMSAFKVDNDDVWEKYVKANKVKGVSLQGDFLYIN